MMLRAAHHAGGAEAGYLFVERPERDGGQCRGTTVARREERP